jgi:hypothetical protein
VPHHRSDHFTGDPTHVRAITSDMLTLFSKRNCQRWRELNAANTPLADYLDIDFEIDHHEVVLTPHWQIKADQGLSPEQIDWALKTYNNVATEVRFRLRKIAIR